MFPAFARLPRAAPEVDWAGLTQSGLAAIARVEIRRGRPARSDWQSFADGVPAPAKGFAHAFSYDAIRIPLYMAMAGVGERATYAPFLKLWERSGPVVAVDLDSGVAKGLWRAGL